MPVLSASALDLDPDGTAFLREVLGSKEPRIRNRTPAMSPDEASLDASRIAGQEPSPRADRGAAPIKSTLSPAYETVR